MRTALKVSTVLSWVNIVIWAILALMLLLMGLGTGSTLLLLFAVLFVAVILHGNTILKLVKSIRQPAEPLARQTITGMRITGFVAMFFGLNIVMSGVVNLNNVGDFLKMMQTQMNQIPQGRTPTIGIARAAILFSMLVGLSVLVNVVLGFRLLRWYLISRSNQDENN